jgi:hypothetical protein
VSVRSRTIAGLPVYKRMRTPRCTRRIAGTEITYDPCIYCGMPSDTVDHVPPVSRAETLLDLDPNMPLWTVPACLTCNRWLGAHPEHTAGGRRAIVRDKLGTLAKGRRFVQWSDEEMAEVGPNMRREIAAKMRQDELILIRMQWARDPIVLLDVNGEPVPEALLRAPSRHIPTRMCEQCGSEYVVERKSKRAFCSITCRHAHNMTLAKAKQAKVSA